MSPTQQKPKVDLDRLSPDEKAQLLAELQAEQQAEAEALVTVRNDAMKSLMSDRDHLKDCPTGRTEMYAATRPADPKKARPEQPVTVVRCQECGGSTVLDESYEDAVRRLEAIVAEAGDVDETEEEVEA